jgi:hypothetical protein
LKVSAAANCELSVLLADPEKKRVSNAFFDVMICRFAAMRRFAVG